MSTTPPVPPASPALHPAITGERLVPFGPSRSVTCPFGTPFHGATHTLVTQTSYGELTGVSCERHHQAARRDAAKAVRHLARRGGRA